jgi:hypothetical protein
MVTKSIVIRSSEAVFDSIARSEIAMDSLKPYAIPLFSMRTHDAFQTTLPGTAANDDMAIITGTPGTDAPTLQGVDFGGTSTDEKCGFQFVLPPEYEAGGQIQVIVRAAMLTTVSDGTATVDVECWPQNDNGAAAADICATAAQSINSLTPADKTFTITPTSRVAGDVLNIRLAFAGSDTGNLGVMIPEISKVTVRLDIRG